MLFQESEDENLLNSVVKRLQMIYRKKIDKYILYTKTRWLITIISAIIYINRVLTLEQFYVITYLIGMNQLQSLLEYLTPLGLPQIGEEDDEDDELQFQNDFCELPTSLSNKDHDRESRPLLRQASEFQVWQRSQITFLIGYAATFIPFLDLPVYWPFLVVYFIFLIMLTFKKYKKHMHKYGYTLFDFTKKK